MNFRIGFWAAEGKLQNSVILEKWVIKKKILYTVHLTPYRLKFTFINQHINCDTKSF